MVDLNKITWIWPQQQQQQPDLTDDAAAALILCKLFSAIEASYFCLFQTSSTRDRTSCCRTCNRLPTLFSSINNILFFIFYNYYVIKWENIYLSIQSQYVYHWLIRQFKEGGEGAGGARGACSIDSRDGPNLRCFIGWALSLWAWMISLIILINFVFNLNVQCF